MEFRSSLKRFAKRNTYALKDGSIDGPSGSLPSSSTTARPSRAKVKHDLDATEAVLASDHYHEPLPDASDVSSASFVGISTSVDGSSCGSTGGASNDLKFMDDSTSSSSCTSASPSSSSSVLRGGGGGGSDQDENRESSPFDLPVGLVNGHQANNSLSPVSRPVSANVRLPPLATQPSRIPVPLKSSPVYTSSGCYKPPSPLRSTLASNLQLTNGHVESHQLLPERLSVSSLKSQAGTAVLLVNGRKTDSVDSTSSSMLPNHYHHRVDEPSGDHSSSRPGLEEQRGSPQLYPPPPTSPSLVLGVPRAVRHPPRDQHPRGEGSDTEDEVEPAGETPEEEDCPCSSPPRAAEDLLSPIQCQKHQVRSENQLSCPVAQQQQQQVGSDAESDTESIYHQPPKAADRDAASRLAKRLFNLDGFRITDVAKHLCKRNDFSQLVGEEFAGLFDFSDQRLDVALRSFLNTFSLTGESQERERVLVHFSRRYQVCNPGKYPDDDACHTLVCALMLLNTDLHNQGVTKKMSCQDFITNLRQTQSGLSYDRDELKTLYEGIKEEPFRWPSVEPNMLGYINVYYPPGGVGPGVYGPGAGPGYLPQANHHHLYAGHPMMLAPGVAAPAAGGLMLPPTPGQLAGSTQYYAPGSLWAQATAGYPVSSASGVHPAMFNWGSVLGSQNALAPYSQLVEMSVCNSEVSSGDRKSSSPAAAAAYSGSSSLNMVCDVHAREYMRGLLVRKWVMDSHGKKTPIGRRGWKMYYARLRDLVLCLYKNAVVANAATSAEELHLLHQQQEQQQQCLHQMALHSRLQYLLYQQQQQKTVAQHQQEQEQKQDTDWSGTSCEEQGGEERQQRSTGPVSDEEEEVAKEEGEVSPAGPDQPKEDGAGEPERPALAGDHRTGGKVTEGLEADASARTPAAALATAGSASTPNPPQPDSWPTPPVTTALSAHAPVRQTQRLPKIPAPESVVRLAHAFASRAKDYVKKANVFRLRTREGAEYLFEVLDPKELDAWIDYINFVAALYSSPSMPCAVGSERAFYRPHLPVTRTRLNMREQLEEHQRRLLELNRDLADFQKRRPSTPQTSRRARKPSDLTGVELGTRQSGSPGQQLDTKRDGDNKVDDRDKGGEETTTTSRDRGEEEAAEQSIAVPTSGSSNSLISVFSTASLGRRRKSLSRSDSIGGGGGGGMTAKQRAELDERIDFTLSEIQRYKTYARLLEAELFRLQEASFAAAAATASATPPSHLFPAQYLAASGGNASTGSGFGHPLIYGAGKVTGGHFPGTPQLQPPPPPRYLLPAQPPKTEEVEEGDTSSAGDAGESADTDRVRSSSRGNPSGGGQQFLVHPAYLPLGYYNSAAVAPSASATGTGVPLLSVGHQAFSPSVSGRVYGQQQQHTLSSRQLRGGGHQQQQLRHRQQQQLTGYSAEAIPVNGAHRLTEEESGMPDSQSTGGGELEELQQQQDSVATGDELKRHPSVQSADTTFYEFV